MEHNILHHVDSVSQSSHKRKMEDQATENQTSGNHVGGIDASCVHKRNIFVVDQCDAKEEFNKHYK
jgi:hypothetical protein